MKLLCISLSELFCCMQLAYLPHRRRELIIDDENFDRCFSPEGSGEPAVDTSKEDKKGRKQGLLNWFKVRVCTTTINFVVTIVLENNFSTNLYILFFNSYSI